MLPASFTLSPSPSATFCLSLPATKTSVPFRTQQLSLESLLLHMLEFCCRLLLADAHKQTDRQAGHLGSK